MYTKIWKMPRRGKAEITKSMLYGIRNSFEGPSKRQDTPNPNIEITNWNLLGLLSHVSGMIKQPTR